MIYIIDGYNVLHYREEGDIPSGQLEEKRKAFVEEVVSFAASEGVEAIVVFDSKQSRETVCNKVPKTKVTVCYASKKLSADILIGKLVKEELRSREGRIRVVSADWEVQVGAMQERVERLTPRNFLSAEKNIAKKLAKSSEIDKIRWKVEERLDSETRKKLEELRRGNDNRSENN